jgi:hypothetical protein
MTTEEIVRIYQKAAAKVLDGYQYDTSLHSTNMQMVEVNAIAMAAVLQAAFDELAGCPSEIASAAKRIAEEDRR